jgi:uncharacterized protein (TIGR03086 family)
MTNWTQHYLDNADRFTAVVDATDEWTAQSPCDDWTATDVLEHVVDTQRDYLTKQGAPLQAKPEATPDVVWHSHLDAVRRALADRDFATESFDGYFGPTTVEDLLANFYGFDMSVHRWDLGRSTEQDVIFGEAEMDDIQKGIEGLGESLYGPGVCKDPLDVPNDAPRQIRLLGLLGRTA